MKTFKRISHNRVDINIDQSPALPFEVIDVTDQVGHGTHVAGIIGATIDNNKAIAGLNWNIEIIPVKACDPHPIDGARCTESQFLLALNWLTHQDVDIVNLSIGINYNQSNQEVDPYLDILKAQGVIVVASAGNEGRNDCIYPAVRGEVVCVGATDQNDALAVNTSGRIDADILAPGVSIISTVPPNSIFDGNGDGVETLNGDNTQGGTSMAAAYVSGVTALCLTVAPVGSPRADLKCDHYYHNGYGRIDAWATLWYKNCKRFDNNNTGLVSLVDIWAVALRANFQFPYDSKYDVYPVGGDGKVDISDAYVEISRMGSVCQ